MLDYVQKSNDYDKKEVIRYQLALVRKQIEELGEEEMSEKKFKGEIFEDDDKFDYGDREILKNVELEDQLDPPFREFQLFRNKNSHKKYSIYNGFFVGGVPDGSFVRCAISVKWLETIQDDYDTEDD